MNKEQMELILKRTHPHATKELIAKMMTIYIYVSQENQKTKEKIKLRSR